MILTGLMVSPFFLLDGYHLLTSSQTLHLHLANKKKAAAVAAGAPNEPHLGDENPHFTFFL